ncbi:hypothetical protein [Halobacteriovorax sp. HLS]|uniref:hypothetical protein n=1 Tax=Halobacteriovorax sp. HLS TaxID=2234000 RepID=UPI000FD78EE8|nr:hypothetical protein [Halobacteriovorax sp. HLS]
MRKKVIKQIDDFIFKQLDAFKESPAKAKIDETMNSLSEQQLKIVSQAGSYLLILVPIFVMLAFFISNSMLKSTIETKASILEEIQFFIAKKNEVERVGSRIISPHQVLNRNDLNQRLNRLAQRKSISPSNISVASFEPLEQSGNISKSEAMITVKLLTSANLSDLIIGLLQAEKVKIEEIVLKRDTTKSLISGTIKITHYGKVAK